MRHDVGRSAKFSGPHHNRQAWGRRISELLETQGNAVVLVTIVSVIVSTLVGVGVISPLLFTAAVFPFFYAAMRKPDHRWGVVLVFRWALALFVTLLVVGVFVPARLGASLPLSDGAVRAIEIWIHDPSAAPPADLNYILWGMLVFLVASVVSGGLLGFLIGAVALGAAAYGALFVFRHGFNIVQIALVAVPLWQLCLFVSGAFIIVPLSVFVFERFFQVGARVDDRELLRQYMYVSAALFLLSIVFRYATAGFWRSLLDSWTVL